MVQDRESKNRIPVVQHLGDLGDHSSLEAPQRPPSHGLEYLGIERLDQRVHV